MLPKIVQIPSACRELIGASGRRYLYKELIQERPHLGRVWLATSDQNHFVLKDIPKDIFCNFRENIWPRLCESPYIRLPCDTILGQRIFVYRYLDDDLLSLVRKQIPMKARKQILKSSLQGVSELHDRDVVHLDIKPDNIMAGYHYTGQETIIDQVQITDLENAAYLPAGRCIKGMLAGNENWRSPEGHFKGELSKPTDIFSFGAVCVYAMLGRVIFGPDEDFHQHQTQGAFPAMIRLQRQVSYFGDQEALDGLIKYVGDEEINCQVLQILWEERAEEHILYERFSDWPDVSDASFRDLVQRMMHLDPRKRITARQALEHSWFRDTETT